MLEIRPNCENCNAPLPPDSEKAMICTYECTFCVTCVDEILKNVCPNCGGGFQKRPVRPKPQLEKHPPSQKRVFKPVDMGSFKELKDKYVNISPKDR